MASLLAAASRVLSTPARQAAAWAALGVVGAAFAVAGVLLLAGDDGSTVPAHLADERSATATPARTPTAASALDSPEVLASPSPEEPVPTPEALVSSQPVSGGGGSAPQQASQDPPEQATSDPEPSEVPQQQGPGRPYCSTISNTAPPNSVIGIFTITGVPAPAGTTVGLAFDGVAGPSRATIAAGGYKVDYGAAGAACANRVGATISVIYNGVSYDTGHTVGDSPGGPVVFTLEIP